MIKNKELKEKLGIFTERTVDLLSKAFDASKLAHNDKNAGIYIVQLRGRIEGLDGFSESVKALEDDKRMKSMLNKLVGTHASRGTIGDGKNVVLGFITLYYIRYGKFTKHTFDDRYKDLEELFFSKTMRLKDSCPLYNFDSDVDEIDLEDGWTIRKKTSEAKPDEDLFVRHKYDPYSQFSKSNFIIERLYERKKIIGDPKKDIEDAGKMIQEDTRIFDLVVKSLRILKSSGVYRDKEISTETLTFTPHGGIHSRFPFKQSIAIGDKCIVNEKECEELRDIFCRLKSLTTERYTIAIDRLSFASEKSSLHDKVIDYMIGLENLYLPKTKHELRAQISLRVALMLESDVPRQKELYAFVKSMYDARSDIVHGSKLPVLDQVKVSKLEEILRSSVKIAIEDESKFFKSNLEDLYFVKKK